MAKLSKRKQALLAFLSNYGSASNYVIKNHFAWKPGDIWHMLKALGSSGFVGKSYHGTYRYWAVTAKGREAIGQQRLPLED